jgi:signal transduction histidine kinase
MPAEYYQIMWDIIKRQKKVFVGEIQNKRRNGELYTAALSISPLLDKNGDVMFFVGVERDITKEKEIDRAKSEFVSLASHQLRTPPSIIGWYTETLQSGDLGPINEKQADYLAEIYRANQRMIAVINSLLNISRIEMNSFSMSPRETDVTGIIDETIRELNVRFNRTITIRKHYDPALGFFNVDPNIAEIIVENLLSNSFKYTPPENAEIEITAKRDHDALFLSVQDNGIGILPKDEGQIFEKLFRADNGPWTLHDQKDNRERVGRKNLVQLSRSPVHRREAGRPRNRILRFNPDLPYDGKNRNHETGPRTVAIVSRRTPRNLQRDFSIRRLFTFSTTSLMGCCDLTK